MGFYYVLATPEMIAEVDRKRREGVERSKSRTLSVDVRTTGTPSPSGTFSKA
jgi:hypothetical protein